MLKLELQYFGHLMRRTDSFEKIPMLGKVEGQRRRRWQRMKCLDNITNSMDMNLSRLREIVEDRGAWHAAVHGVAKSWHPTPVLLPGKSQGWGSLVGCCLWGHTESDMTEVT